MDEQGYWSPDLQGSLKWNARRKLSVDSPERAFAIYLEELSLQSVVLEALTAIQELRNARRRYYRPTYLKTSPEDTRRPEKEVTADEVFGETLEG